MVGWIGLLAGLAFAVPSIDEPVKTGLKADQDAALVIGIEDYAFLPDVPYAARDAAAFYAWARYTKGVPGDRIALLDSSPSREDIEAALKDLSKQVGKTGTMWVYFAGHGAADPQTGQRVVLGADAKSTVESFGARGVAVDAISAAAVAGATVMLIDACFTGVGRDGAALSPERFVVPQYSKAAAPKILEWNAAAASEASGPLDAVQHGAFTYFALGALRGWADGQVDDVRDGVVTAEEADEYVRQALKTVQVKGQHPVMRAPDRAAMLVSSEKLETAPELSGLIGSQAKPVSAEVAVVTAPGRELSMLKVRGLQMDLDLSGVPFVGINLRDSLVRQYGVEARWSGTSSVVPSRRLQLGFMVSGGITIGDYYESIWVYEGPDYDEINEYGYFYGAVGLSGKYVVGSNGNMAIEAHFAAGIGAGFDTTLFLGSDQGFWYTFRRLRLGVGLQEQIGDRSTSLGLFIGLGVKLR